MSKKNIIIISSVGGAVLIIVLGFLFFNNKNVAAALVPGGSDYLNNGCASEAKIALRDIHKKSIIYTQETGGQYPSDISEIEDAGYLDLAKSVKENWTFLIDVQDGETGTLTATSTDEMGGGPDLTVIYNLETGKFTGSLEFADDSSVGE